MIASISKIKEILNNYNIPVKKKFGQNFLIDSNVVKKIVNTANVNKETIVVEIGPGLGSMTEELCQKASKVICFEIDQDMVNVLTNELSFENLTIVEEDFLKVDLSEYLTSNLRTIVVSNLPYYITTPIISSLIKEKEVSEIYVMVQDEVASRLTSGPGTKDYGSLSVLMGYYFECKYEFKVTRNCFYPSPNVDSGIVSMKKMQRDCGLNNEDKFARFVQDIFENRRKTLINNIIRKYPVERTRMEDILDKMGYDVGVRSERLSLDDMIYIYKEIGLN